MRNTIDIAPDVLAFVVGGCKKHGSCQQAAPQQPPQAVAAAAAVYQPPPPPPSPSVDVTVATGAAGGQAIQQALGGGSF